MASWSCLACEFENDDSAASCGYCGEARELRTTSSSAASGAGGGGGARQPAAGTESTKAKRPERKKTSAKTKKPVEEDDVWDLASEDSFVGTKSTSKKRALRESDLVVLDSDEDGNVYEESKCDENDPKLINAPWAEVFAPKDITELELAVDPKRVTSVKEGLIAGLDGYGHRLLIIHGPSGCGKSTTLRVVAKHLGATVREWSEDSSFYVSGYVDGDFKAASATESFDAFLTNVAYPTLSLKSGLTPASNNGTVILIESLPISAKEPEAAFNALAKCVARLDAKPKIRSCIALIATVEGSSGASPQQLARMVGDINANNALLIDFNEVPSRRLSKTLERISEMAGVHGSQFVAQVVQGNPDLRSAINLLQVLSSGVRLNQKEKSRRQGSKRVKSAKKESAGANVGKDQYWELCHAVGKLLRGHKPGEVPFSYEHVARQCALDPRALAQFVFENFYKYASAWDCDIRSYYTLCDNLRVTEELLSKRWQSLERAAGGDEDIDAAEAYAESIVARTASCWQRYATTQKAVFGGMIQVTRPQTYDVAKEAEKVVENMKDRLRNRMVSSSASRYLGDEAYLVSLIAPDSELAWGGSFKYLPTDRAPRRGFSAAPSEVQFCDAMQSLRLLGEDVEQF